MSLKTPFSNELSLVLSIPSGYLILNSEIDIQEMTVLVLFS